MHEKLGRKSVPTEPTAIEHIFRARMPIEHAARKLARVATEHNQPVVSVFNEITVVALPGDGPESIAARWQILDDLRRKTE